MNDDPLFNIKFVNIVAKYKVLYDNTHENYANRQKHEQTWDEIGKEINEVGPTCRERWKNIRSAYTRHLRQKIPNGTANHKKKNYYLAEHLEFLLPYTKSKKQYGTIPVSDTLIHATNNDLDDDPETTNDNIEETNIKIEIDDTFQNSEQEEEISLPKTNFVEMKPRTSNFPENVALEYICGPENVKDTKTTEDPDLQFLKSILPDMHKMNSYQKHEFKMRIMQNIGEILYSSPILDYPT